MLYGLVCLDSIIYYIELHPEIYRQNLSMFTSNTFQPAYISLGCIPPWILRMESVMCGITRDV